MSDVIQPRKMEFDSYGLPKNEDALVQSLKGATAFAESARNIEAVTWGITRYWLRGIREFDAIDYKTGEVLASLADPGELVVYEEALGAVQAEIGRLLRIDLRPAVEPLGYSLDSLRSAAVGHATLGSLTPRMSYEQAQRQHTTYMVHYGTAGLILTERMLKDGTGKTQLSEWRPRLEVVPPWELLSIPGEVPSPNEVTAVARVRHVPIPWLKYVSQQDSGLLRPKLKMPKDEGKLQSMGYPFGAPIFDSITGEGNSPMFQSAMLDHTDLVDMAMDTARQGHPDAVEHTKLVEFWFSRDHIYLDRYIVMAGDCILGQKDYRELGLRVNNPMGISRYAEVSSFYGRGFAAPRIELNRITERLLEALVQNVEDFDQYGIIFVPRNSGVNRTQLTRPRDDGPRVGTYEPDPLAPNHSPMQIAPVNTGQTAGNVMKLIESVSNNVMPQLSVFSSSAPQRADSGPALSIIDQAANEPRSAASASLSECWTTVWRAALDAARRHYAEKGVLEIVTIDDALVGVVYDAESGLIKISENAIPEPDQVSVTTRSQSPENPQAILQALQGNLTAGIITPREFRIEVRKRGIKGYPVANEAEWNAYQMAILNLIMTFNDGMTPGDPDIRPISDMIDVHLGVYSAFVNSPRFVVASQEVQQKIQDLFLRYRNEKGEFPEGMSHPEDAAMMQQELMKQGGPGGPGGGGAPPDLMKMMGG